MDSGAGRIICAKCPISGLSTLTKCGFVYPLRLSPLPPSECITVYILSFGGGILARDSIQLHIEVLRGAKCALKSQGNTKVFRASSEGACARFTQTAEVSDGGFLAVLPAPTTLFREAKFHQRQEIRMEAGANLVLLDWYTAGRTGEEWAFSSFKSQNLVLIDGVPVLRDFLTLQNPGQRQFRHYTCFATLHLIGPAWGHISAQLSLKAASEQERVRQLRSPPDLLWSWSLNLSDSYVGGTLRVCASEAEDVYGWLNENLKDVTRILGIQGDLIE